MIEAKRIKNITSSESVGDFHDSFKQLALAVEEVFNVRCEERLGDVGF